MNKTKLCRLCSAILAALLLMNCFGIHFGISVAASSDPSTTASKLVASTYDAFLTSDEKAILNCTALAGTVFTYKVPSDSDELVSIDAEKKTLSAKDYKNGGYTWKPISAKIIYQVGGVDQTPIVVTLTNGTGSFTCSANQYRAEVVYELTTEVPEATQRLLLNTPKYLVDGITVLNAVSKLRSDYSSVAQYIGSLYSLANTGIDVWGHAVKLDATKEPETAAAINALYQDTVDNGGDFKIYNLMLEYINAGTNKTQFLAEKGALVKSEFDKFYANLSTVTTSTQITTLVGYAGFTSNPQAATYEDAFNGLKKIVESAKKIDSSLWGFVDKTLVKSGATTQELTTLNTAVLAAVESGNVSFHDSVTIQNPLSIAQTTITQGVDQYKVNVTVLAKVVKKTDINTKTLTTLDNKKTTTLILDKGTTKAQIESAIDGTGIAASALSLWDTYYNVGTDCYSIEVSTIPSTLTGDISVTLTYVPKNYTLTFQYNGTSDSVPYGYNLLLAKHTDATKSYDYTVGGTLYRQDTTFRVTGATTISRKEGKATACYRIPAVIAASTTLGATLSAEEKAVLSSFALTAESIWYREPDQTLASTLGLKVEAISAGQYKVTANDYASGLLSGEAWKATKGHVISASGTEIATFDITSGVGTFSSASFDHVKVTYTLTISDISSAVASGMINLPGTLVSEATSQKTALDKIAKGDLYEGLKAVYGSRLELIGTLSTNYSQAAKDAVQTILDNCVDYSDTEKPLYLYEYATAYNTEGLSYYYTGENSTKFAKQIKLLSDNLNILWEDSKFQQDLENPDIAKYRDRIETIRDMLSELTLAPVNSNIDTNSAYISDLVKAIESANGHTSTHTASGAVALSTDLTVAAPDRANITINVRVVNSNGDIVGTVQTASRGFAIGTSLSSAEATDLKTLVDTLQGKLTVDKKHYTRTADGTLPQAGTKLTGDLVITYTWEPIEYTVKIDGMADQKLAADGSLTITLPACPKANTLYRYTIGTDTVDTTTVAKSYKIASLAKLDSLCEGGVLKITCKEVDLYREEFLKFVQSLNEAVADCGATMTVGGVNTITYAFIPVEKEDGSLGLVFRASPAAFGKIQDVFTKVSLAFAESSYFNTIQFGGETFWDGQLHVQSLVDVFFNSDLSFDKAMKTMDANGNLLYTKESLAIREDYDVIVETGKLVSNSWQFYGSEYIAQVAGAEENFGAELITTTFSFGADSSIQTIPFYITMEDFDKSADDIKTVRNAVEAVSKYADMAFVDGRLQMKLKAPESVYPYYLTGMLLLDFADLSAAQDMDLAESLRYEREVLTDFLNSGKLTASTIERTAKKAGKSIDISSYKTLIDKLVPVLKQILNNSEFIGDSEFNVYTGELQFNVTQFLTETIKLDESLLKFVAETGDGTHVDMGLKIILQNMETEYQALYFDNTASGLKKLQFTTDLASVLPKLGTDSIVILLSDVTLKKAVTIPNRIVLNLNGFTLKGNLNANNTVTVIDSVLDTKQSGAIDGTLSGKFVLTAGKYNTGVSSFLKAGYTQDADGYVHNKYYTMEKSANGDITIYLAGDFMSKKNIPSLSTFAWDVAADLALNIYTSAALTVDGDTLYSVNVKNALDYLSGDLSSVANEALGWVDLDGTSEIVNKILADFTDFGALQTAIESGTTLASYTLGTQKWGISASMIGADASNTVSVGIGTRGTEKKTKLSIALSPDATSAEKKNLAELCAELDSILTIDSLSLHATKLAYENSALKFAGSGNVSVAVDLTKDPSYAAVIASAVASSVTGSYKYELVEALETYLDIGTTDAIKKALDKMSSANAISAIKKLGTESYPNMLTGLGLTSEECEKLVALYSDELSLAATVLNHFNVKGNSAKLGSYATGTFGEYKFTTTTNGIEAKVLLDLVLEDKAIVVRAENGKLQYLGDDLAMAFAAVTEKSTITVNKNVTLGSNITVSTLVYLVGADKVTFGTYTIALGAKDAAVSADKDIASNVISDIKNYKVLKQENGGKYIFSLIVDQLPPTIDDPVVTPSAGQKIIAASKVDNNNKRVFMDLNPEGMTAAQITAVFFQTHYAETTTVVVTNNAGTVTRQNGDVICNGDKVTVTAENAVGKAVSTYTIIVMGDTNCNGRIDSGDAVLMAYYYTGQKQLSEIALLAADMNQNGRIDSGDAVKNATKYTYKWKDGTYSSSLK